MIRTDTNLVLHCSLPASPERIWALWTTPAAVASWWAPDGFSVSVQVLDLRPGGALVYTMTATGREQIAFTRQAGLPLTTLSRKEFTEIDEPGRLAYTSLVDFVPDHESYEHLTVITLARTTSGGTDVAMEIEPMHDETWTERLYAGRANELDNLARLVGNTNLRGELRRY
jgi:uncharacterized protein YndB with AHSA1/START domain